MAFSKLKTLLKRKIYLPAWLFALIMLSVLSLSFLQLYQPPKKQPMTPDRMAELFKERLNARPNAKTLPPQLPIQQLSRLTQDADLVIGILINGVAKAYPRWTFGASNLIQDSLPLPGGQSQDLVIVATPINFGAAAFKLEQTRQTTLSSTARPCGPHSNFPLFQVCDAQDKKLEPLPIYLATWGEWKTRYPNSLILEGTEKMRSNYRPMPKQILAILNKKFQGRLDKRIGENELVLGFRSECRAYSLKSLDKQNGIYEDLDNKTVLIKFNNTTALAFKTDFADKHLTGFTWTNRNNLIFQDQSGQQWNWDGSSVTGKTHLKLPIADALLTGWNEYSHQFPNCQLPLDSREP